MIETDSSLSVPVISLDTFEFWKERTTGEGITLPATGAFLLVDKPQDWTSFDVVAKLRGVLRTKKIGHTGTLDPMATGLLVICLGKATKLADQVQAEQKEYTGVIKLGATTETDDAESEETAQCSTRHITFEKIAEAAKQFTGEIQQVPPMYSAIKVAGERMYKAARRGETIELEPRAVTIYSFELVENKLPYVGFRISCSKGTYIRAIARDLGKALGVGGYLTELRRTRVGDYMVDNALTMSELQSLRPFPVPSSELYTSDRAVQ